MKRLIASFFLFTATLSALDEPSYTVLKKDGRFELRRYAPYIVVETTVTDSVMDDASNAGFRKLFKYITGNNRASAEIAMTAPVLTESSRSIPMTAPVTTVRSEGGYTIGFVMPAEFTLGTTPVPNDSTLTVRQVPARTVAVIRFSGRWTDEAMSERTVELIGWVSSSGLSPVGSPVIARYDPPIMPWFLRRNEIQLQIAQ
ncbi:MAG: heme-binding protein [Bacteroidetes bacterium]|nr:heme-binding protein [Bacteroidota bacterium]